jgi:site-specific DNA-cytosine methylase
MTFSAAPSAPKGEIGGPRPLLYDLYSGAGGASYGYQLAGFRVIGIDFSPQPRYPCDGFIQMDAFEFFDRVAAGEYEQPSAWAASPP